MICHAETPIISTWQRFSHLLRQPLRKLPFQVLLWVSCRFSIVAFVWTAFAITVHSERWKKQMTRCSIKWNRVSSRVSIDDSIDFCGLCWFLTAVLFLVVRFAWCQNYCCAIEYQRMCVRYFIFVLLNKLLVCFSSSPWELGIASSASMLLVLYWRWITVQLGRVQLYQLSSIYCRYSYYCPKQIRGKNLT